MSKKLLPERDCYDCDLPCVSSCRMLREDLCCEYCGSSADFLIDDTLVCADCAYNIIEERFNELTIQEQAELLGLTIRNLWGGGFDL